MMLKRTRNRNEPVLGLRRADRRRFAPALEACEHRTLLSSIGDRVWFDLNGNGRQEGPPENVANVPGVTVKLTYADGSGPVLDYNNNPVADQVTDANGEYRFTNLLPGTYRVVFVISSFPAGWCITLKDAPPSGSAPGIPNDSQDDSDPDRVTGITDVITVGAGQNIMNIDCGLIPTGTIGDRVWNDANGNGLQDSGEVGVAGVTVTLTDGAGNPVTNAVGQLVGPTVTDANGNYQFDCLPSGTYKVTFSNLPANFSFTTPNVGGDDTIDSDANPTTGMTGTYTLTIGSSPVFENSVDAGIVFVRIEEPPPTGNEGGTPGFWKNNASKHGAVAWGPTGLLPSQKVNTVFSSVTGAAGNQTLLQALSAGGGGLTALLRQAVAAILNALHPDVRYPLTAAQVKTLVNNAVTAGGSAIESAKNTLEGYNELFHPLDQQGRRTIP